MATQDGAVMSKRKKKSRSQQVRSSWQPPNGNPVVGEVGRCLLSSTMLGNSKGISATVDHFAKHLKLAQEQVERPGPSSAQLEELREQLRKETDDFIQLCGENEALLETKLAQQRKHNFYLRKRLLKRQMTQELNQDLGGRTSTRRELVRWKTPIESEYDSDSTAATSTTVTSLMTSLQPPEVRSKGKELYKNWISGEKTNKTYLVTQARDLLQILQRGEADEDESASKELLVNQRELICMALNFMHQNLI